MHISRPIAAILGLVTVWPVVYFVGFVVFMFTTVMWSQTGPSEAWFEAVFVAHLVTMLVTLALLAFYVVHLFKNQALTDDRRVLWAIVLFMGNLFAFPVYWYLYVWHTPSRTLS
jgi:hypothetical protein